MFNFQGFLLICIEFSTMNITFVIRKKKKLRKKEKNILKCLCLGFNITKPPQIAAVDQL